MKREEMGSTEVGDGIVLTHGFHKDVLKTQIAFAKLDKPIIWNTSYRSKGCGECNADELAI